MPTQTIIQSDPPAGVIIPFVDGRTIRFQRESGVPVSSSELSKIQTAVDDLDIVPAAADLALIGEVLGFYGLVAQEATERQKEYARKEVECMERIKVSYEQAQQAHKEAEEAWSRYESLKVGGTRIQVDAAYTATVTANLTEKTAMEEFDATGNRESLNILEGRLARIAEEEEGLELECERWTPSAEKPHLVKKVNFVPGNKAVAVITLCDGAMQIFERDDPAGWTGLAPVKARLVSVCNLQGVKDAMFEFGASLTLTLSPRQGKEVAYHSARDELLGKPRLTELVKQMATSHVAVTSSVRPGESHLKPQTKGVIP